MISGQSVFKMITFTAVIAVLISYLLTSAQPPPSRFSTRVGSAVNTTSGLILGHPARNRTGVSEYLGIRYAHAAEGVLRFQPPEEYKSTLVYEAADWVSQVQYRAFPVLINLVPVCNLYFNSCDAFIDQLQALAHTRLHRRFPISPTNLLILIEFMAPSWAKATRPSVKTVWL